MLWIGAHPDDESVASPLLADVCRERGARCTLFVVTRGESGDCARAGGCSPDLAAVRVAEMQRAAAVLGATVIQWDLPDVATGTPQAVFDRWTARFGSAAAMQSAFLAAISQVRPEVVLSFDARHGSTCHPAHRASSAFAKMLLDGAVITSSQLLLAETRFDIRPDLSSIGYAPVFLSDATQMYDGQTLLAGARKTAWEVMLDGLGAHESQFDARKLMAFAAAPAVQRRVFFLPADAALAAPDDPRASICPP